MSARVIPLHDARALRVAPPAVVRPAGLPLADALGDCVERYGVNIVGGCCGTTPDHIRHVAEEVLGVPPRAIPERPVALRLSGLEPFELVA